MREYAARPDRQNVVSVHHCYKPDCAAPVTEHCKCFECRNDGMYGEFFHCFEHGRYAEDKHRAKHFRGGEWAPVEGS